MLVERPLPTEYAFAQQERNLLNQHMFGWHVRHNQFPVVNVQGYQGISAEKVQARHQGLGCNTHMGTFSSGLISATKPNLVSGGPTSNGKPGRAVRRNYAGMKEEVFAFGPKHAEHARRFYQSKGSKPQFGQVLVPSCRADYGAKQIQYKQTQARGYLSGESVLNVENRPKLYPCNLDGAVTSSVASEPYETVLKVANISPRPDKRQGNKQKTLFDLLENANNEKVDQVDPKKSIDFRDKEDGTDLSNAPIFQILCEISEM